MTDSTPRPVWAHPLIQGREPRAYPSIRQASYATAVPPKEIRACLANPNTSYGGYRFSVDGDIAPRQNHNRNPRPVLEADPTRGTVIVHRSITQAARAAGWSVAAMSRALSTGPVTHNNHIWRLKESK